MKHFPTSKVAWLSSCVLVLMVELFFVTTEGMLEENDLNEKCMGYCTGNVRQCKDQGGRVTGFCTKYLACCDPLKSSMAQCGDTKTNQRIVHFKSPNYPNFTGGDVNCQIKVELLQNVVAIKIDFLHVEMDGPGFSEPDSDAGSCEADMIFFRGFGSWAPAPHCGNISGYSFLVNKNNPQSKNLRGLTLIALMSSEAYRWHIRIVQLVKTLQYEKQYSMDMTFSNVKRSPPVVVKGKRSLLTPMEYKDKDLQTAETAVVPVVISASVNTSHQAVVVSSSSINKTDTSHGAPAMHSLGPPTTQSVVHGEDTMISSVPWQVSFRYKAEVLSAAEIKEKQDMNCSVNEGTHFCGGSIISDSYILTAAHCFYGISKTSGWVPLPAVKAVVGDSNTCTDDSHSNNATSRDHDIESVIVHYAYDSRMLFNDIAVVKLKTPIQFADHVQPIHLAQSGESFYDSEALLSGWGDYIKISPLEEDIVSDEVRENGTVTSTDDSIAVETTEGPIALSTNSTDNLQYTFESPNILQSSRRLVIQNKTTCTKKDMEEQYLGTTVENVLKYMKYRFVFDSVICTSSRVDDNDKPVLTGKGDSGGPLVVNRNNDTSGGANKPISLLVGVVSYSYSDEESCTLLQDIKDNRTFDFYSSVSFYRNWIDLAVLSYGV